MSDDYKMIAIITAGTVRIPVGVYTGYQRAMTNNERVLDRPIQRMWLAEMMGMKSVD